MATFTPPADKLVPPIAIDSRDVTDPLAQRLFRFYSAKPRGRNVFILKNNTVTENLPAATYDSNGVLVQSAWDQVAVAFYGGHGGYAITGAQQTLLTNAGYGPNIT